MSEQRTVLRLQAQIRSLERELDHRADVVSELADRLAAMRAERDYFMGQLIRLHES